MTAPASIFRIYVDLFQMVGVLEEDLTLVEAEAPLDLEDRWEVLDHPCWNLFMTKDDLLDLVQRYFCTKDA